MRGWRDLAAGPWARPTLGLLALLTLAMLPLEMSLVPMGRVVFDAGPNDDEYIVGFREDWEIEPRSRTRFHWTRPQAAVRLPLHLMGNGHVLRLRARRHLTEPALVSLTAEGREVGRFSLQAQRGSAYQVFEFPLPDLAGRHTFELGLRSSSASPRPLGIALDWIEIIPRGAGARLRLPGAVRLRLGAVGGGAFLIVLLAGGSLRLALFHAVALLGAAVAGAARDPLALERILREGSGPYLATGVLALVLVRVPRLRAALRIDGRRTAALLLVLVSVATVVRLVILLHPRFYYPDVRVHAVLARELAKLGVQAFLENYTALQYRYSLGLQFEHGHWYAFPYPPAFYFLCYPLLRLAHWRPEIAVAVVPAIVNSLEVFLIFGLGRRLTLGVGGALAAAAMHPLLPIFVTRLALAYFPAIVGHAVDMMVLLYLVSRATRLGQPRVAGALGLLVALALLTYTQSVLNLGLLLPLFLASGAILERGREARLRQAGLAAAGILGVILALSFYGRYIPIFAGMRQGVTMPEERVLLERMARSSQADQEPEAPDDPFAGPGLNPVRGLKKAVWRLYLFYDVFGLAVLAGLYLLLRKAQPGPVWRLIACWAATYLLLNLASGGLPGPNLVRYNKDVLALAPLACVALGALAAAWPRRLRLLGVLLLLGFLGFGAARAQTALTQTFYTEGR